MAAQVVCAFLLALGFASRDDAWLGLFSLPTLLLAIRFLSPLRAMVCGATWGGSFFFFASGHQVVPMSPGVLALLVVVPAAYTLLGTLLTRSRIGFSPLLLAAMWIGVEYAFAPIGLRFGLLSGALVSGTPVSGTLAGGGFVHVIAGVLGYGFVAFAIAYVNGLLLWLLADVCGSCIGPLFVPGVSDLGTFVIPQVLVYNSRRTCSAARPRAPPLS